MKISLVSGAAHELAPLNRPRWRAAEIVYPDLVVIAFNHARAGDDDFVPTVLIQVCDGRNGAFADGEDFGEVWMKYAAPAVESYFTCGARSCIRKRDENVS